MLASSDNSELINDYLVSRDPSSSRLSSIEASMLIDPSDSLAILDLLIIEVNVFFFFGFLSMSLYSTGLLRVQRMSFNS